MSDQINDDRNEGLSPELRTLSEEARDHDDDLPELPELDFDKMEKALMARVEDENARRRVRSRAAWIVGGLAVAAAAVLAVGRTTSEAPVAGAQITADPGAGALETGTVTSHGKALERGAVLRQGDSVESTYAVFRSDGRVVYSLGDEGKSQGAQGSSSTEVSVTNTDRPIVLALAHGVVEAQVDKVPSGEAFAVDVPSVSNSAMKNANAPESNVRIAVHGTHLRVARTGNHVTLDLTEGVVSVGHPPKIGMTNGKEVTAPAHAEFDADALEATFTITNDASHVQAAALKTTSAQGSNDSPIAIADNKAVTPVNANHLEKKAPSSTNASANSKDPLAQSPAPENEVAPVDSNKAATDAVVACVRANVQPGDVKLTVTTNLSLRIGDDGSILAARFDPPLDPAAQQCAANAVAKVHFPKSGSVMLPITVVK